MKQPYETPPAASKIAPEYSIKHLVVAAFEHAVREARKGDNDVREWIYAEGVLWLDIVLDIHAGHVPRWLDRQLKRQWKPSQAQRDTSQMKALLQVLSQHKSFCSREN
jgi:hypothetical protein